MKNLLTLITLLLSGLVMGHDVELRFSENRVEGDLLFIDIAIRASTYDFNLASHNIRAFYDHASLELVDVTSQLPEGKYGSPSLDQMFTDGYDVEVGALSFEDHMGFINMSVQLNDTKSGGMDITTDWVTIHTATFKIMNTSGRANIVWANESKTGSYATAFVEVAEWVSADEIVTMETFDLVNFDQEIKQVELEDLGVEVKIGPNPTSSVANIYQPQSGSILSIIDMSGSVILERGLEAGMTVVNVEELTSGSYVFLVQMGQESHVEQIMITE